MEKMYTAVATTKGGRNGHVSSSDGVLNLDLRSPKAMGGEDGYSNPEQLFAAGYAACFDSAMNIFARRMRLDVAEAEITAEISIGRDEKDEGYMLRADIIGTFPKHINEEQAASLMNEAHKFCPYSKAIRGNVEVTLHHKIKK